MKIHPQWDQVAMLEQYLSDNLILGIQVPSCPEHPCVSFELRKQSGASLETAAGIWTIQANPLQKPASITYQVLPSNHLTVEE